MVARGIASRCLMGSQFQSGNLKKLEVDDGDDCTTVRMYLMPQNCTLQSGLSDKFYV